MIYVQRPLSRSCVAHALVCPGGMISLWQLAASNLLAQEAGCQRFKDGK
ncbi:MAG: hypothetical protein OXC07_03715 [Kistimonas sp.]|nr:hypothetical protein [Kistimonas sp.]